MDKGVKELPRIGENSSIDEWAVFINAIYEEQYRELTFMDILILFYEDIGKCYQLLTRRNDKDIPYIIPSMFRWFCLLYSKNVDKKNSISDLLWNKFPGICPYCLSHPCACAQKEHLDEERLNEIRKKSKENEADKPRTLNEWQKHFHKIYPKNQDSLKPCVDHLTEELAELSESYRKKFVEPNIECIEMELADVFSWLVGLANIYEQVMNFKFGKAILEHFKYGCPDCEKYRKNHKISNVHCCCFSKVQEFRLIHDYDFKGEQEETQIEELSREPRI